MDGNEARRAAARAEAAAGEVRAAALALGGAAGVEWRSVAAEAFRRRLAEEGERARRAAALLDEAGVALHRHARAVDVTVHTLRRVLP